VSEMQVQLGNALLKALVDMKQTKKQLNIEDVGALFEQMASSLTNKESKADAFIRQEIEKIASHISHALTEIAAITPLDNEEGDEEDNIRNISFANAELAAVVKATEQATNNILDAADVIQEKVTGLTGDEALKQEIVDSTIKIYDACNFQDITGQRIGKVARTLDYLDTKISKLKRFIDESSVENNEVDEEFRDKRPDAKLMSGPQMPGSAPSQDEIDQLFANIK